MKNSEHTIEKVLADLRSVEAPPDMERRILIALESRTSSPAVSVWRRLSSTWPVAHARALAACAAFAIASVVAVVLITPAIHHASHIPAPPVRSTSSASPLPSTVETIAVQSAPDKPIALKAAEHRVKKMQPEDPEEALAESEMRAPSMLAPPMPLTDQEKLLLRLVHANDPVELASLDRKSWAAQFALSKAQFDKFFAPPKTDLTGEQQ